MEQYIDWIKQFENDESPIGDLARDIGYDKKFPKSNSKSHILNYLKGRNACDGAIEAFTRSWDFFQR